MYVSLFEFLLMSLGVGLTLMLLLGKNAGYKLTWWSILVPAVGTGIVFVGLRLVAAYILKDGLH